MQFNECDFKADFSAWLLQSSHDASEIILIRWFDAQEPFLITVFLDCLNNFLEIVPLFYESITSSFIQVKMKLSTQNNSI